MTTEDKTPVSIMDCLYTHTPYQRSYCGPKFYLSIPSSTAINKILLFSFPTSSLECNGQQDEERPVGLQRNTLARHPSTSELFFSFFLLTSNLSTLFSRDVKGKFPFMNIEDFMAGIEHV